MSPAGPGLLGARRSPGAAAVAVVLRSARWPYSCGLACSMQVLAHRLARAGGELVLAIDEPASRRAVVGDVWGLDAPLVPLAPPLADELGLREPATGRAEDGVGVLTPSGVWAATWNFGDPFGSAHPDQVVRAVQELGLPAVGEPAPEPRPQARSAAPGDRGVCTRADAARALGRALTSVERTTSLLGAELAARRLRAYVTALDPAALDTIRNARHAECTTTTPTPS